MRQLATSATWPPTTQQIPKAVFALALRAPANTALQETTLSFAARFTRLLKAVHNSGPGIPAELQKRLFQPFSAGQASTGSGLGLAICLEITRTLGGQIDLINRENRGQIDGLDAVLRLPLASVTAAAQEV
jgi:signal transduction histidine kinase